MRKGVAPWTLVPLLAACAAVDAPPRPAERPAARAPASATAEDGAAVAADAPSAEERRAAWIAGLKERLPPEWAAMECGDTLLFLHDREVPVHWLRGVALDVVDLLKSEFLLRFPPAGPFEGPLVLRVCKDRTQFARYGGPEGSAGYWNPAEGESVGFYDRGDKRDAARTLRGIAFLQYLARAGAGGAHPWFAHGLAEYYAGFDRDRGGRLRAKPNLGRRGQFKHELIADRPLPLPDFVRCSRSAFYGDGILLQFAQAWSLAWFLRRTRNPAWHGMLERYYLALRDRVADGTAGRPVDEPWRETVVPEEVQEEARAAALEAAFGGLDDAAWARLEKEWRDFKY